MVKKHFRKNYPYEKSSPVEFIPPELVKSK